MDKSKARCSAFDKAVNLLAFKDRTRQEIINKLKDKGYSSDEIDDAVEKLAYYGYLNDQNYTISYIRDNTSKKGRKLIENELTQKGVDKSIVNHIYENVEVDENSVIDEILNRRFSNVDYKDDKSYRRLVGYFMRKGFDYDSVRRVIRNHRNRDEIGC